MKHNLLNSIFWLFFGALFGWLVPQIPDLVFQGALAFFIACIRLLFVSTWPGRLGLAVCFSLGFLGVCWISQPVWAALIPFALFFVMALPLASWFGCKSGKIMLARSLFFLSWTIAALLAKRGGVELLVLCTLCAIALYLHDDSLRIFDGRFWKEIRQRKLEMARHKARNRLIENLMQENLARLRENNSSRTSGPILNPGAFSQNSLEL